jgi:hypothetical protein
MNRTPWRFGALAETGRCWVQVFYNSPSLFFPFSGAFLYIEEEKWGRGSKPVFMLSSPVEVPISVLKFKATALNPQSWIHSCAGQNP